MISAIFSLRGKWFLIDQLAERRFRSRYAHTPSTEQSSGTDIKEGILWWLMDNFRQSSFMET